MAPICTSLWPSNIHCVKMKHKHPVLAHKHTYSEHLNPSECKISSNSIICCSFRFDCASSICSMFMSFICVPPPSTLYKNCIFPWQTYVPRAEYRIIPPENCKIEIFIHIHAVFFFFFSFFAQRKLVPDGYRTQLLG